MQTLKGKNQIAQFRRVANELAAQTISYKGVVGVAFIGGLVRGFADKFSDIDILVFLSPRDRRLRKQIVRNASSMQKRLGIDIDLEAHFLEDFRKQRWCEYDKWEFSRAQIVFDPWGKVAKLFAEKLRVPSDFWLKRIVGCAEHLKWYCCPPKKNAGTIAESWLQRGDPASAHYSLNYAVDLLVRMLFALNKEFLPAPKWRLYYSYSLEWQPKRFRQRLKQAMTTKNLSEEELTRRLKTIRKLWRQVLPKIATETKLTPRDISEYYVQKILGVGT